MPESEITNYTRLMVCLEDWWVTDKLGEVWSVDYELIEGYSIPSLSSIGATMRDTMSSKYSPL